MSVSLAGARVLVTGASGGLGPAIARALHGRGARLVLSGRREDALEALRGELGSDPETALADLAAPDGVDRLLERTGRIDVLVANAGLPASGRLETYAAEEVDRALAVNLRAPIQLSRALVPGMVERGTGHLVFMASMAAKVASGGGSIYSATKFGLRGFAAALRDELRGTGVGVTAILPGFISEAGMWAETGVDLPRGVGTPRPDEVARAVVEGIERDRDEIDVAPLPVRATGWVAAVKPGLVNAMNRRLGSRDIAERLAEAQRVKR